jgi:hypothetical protein
MKPSYGFFILLPLFWLPNIRFSSSAVGRWANVALTYQNRCPDAEQALPAFVHVAMVAVSPLFVCRVKSYTSLSLGVVLTENDVNPGDALRSEFERFNLFSGHANENFEQAGVGLLLNEDCQLIAQFSELERIQPRHFGLRCIRLHKRPTPRTGTAEGCVTRLFEYSRGRCGRYIIGASFF